MKFVNIIKDTYSNLSSQVLEKGEMGVATDEYVVRIGDGVNTFENLDDYPAIIAKDSTELDNYNPIIGNEEILIETDTNKVKIGDGETFYKKLPENTGVFIDCGDSQ